MPTKIKASQVVEDTLEDKDGNTKVSVESSTNEDKIRFTTGGTERMIIQDDGKVGIGDNITPGYKLDVDGDVRIRGGDIRDNSGDKVIEMDGSGFLKFTKGIKYSRGVLVSSASSPSASGGSPDGGWIKFATFSCPGTSNLDTAASSFLITIAGMESSNNRALDGTFLVHAKFTVNTAGTGTDGGSISNAYYEPEGTYVYCEPLNADRLSATGVDQFDPSTDLLMIFPNNTSTPNVDLYIRACAKTKRCFATHLGGTGQVDTFDTDIGFAINTEQSWLTSEPVAPANNAKITGTWASKVFSKLDVYGDTSVGGKIGIMIESTTPSQPMDGEGYIYSKSDGKLYWRSHDVNEVDLTAAGGGGTSKHFAIGHVDLTTNNKPVNWINASSISASSGIKSWYIVPFAGTIDKVIVTVKANNFDNTNDGNITLSIFKNQANYDSTIVNQTVGANDFTEKVSNMAGGTTDCNQKIFAGLNQSIAEGDLIHVKVGKSTGADREAIVTMIYTS